MDEDPIKLLRELEASGEVTPEQVREAIIRALWKRNRSELESFAAKFDQLGRPDLAIQIREMTQGKPRLQ